MDKEIVIYTCIVANFDTLRPIPDRLYAEMSKKADFLCFTDNVDLYSRSAGNWKIVEIPETLYPILRKNPVKAQRILKILPMSFLPDPYRKSLWIDSNFEIRGNVVENLVLKYDLNKFPIYTNKHPSRNCIYDEEEAVIRLNKDNPETVKAQMIQYMGEKYPVDNGLAETNVILRRHDSIPLIKTLNLWADQIINWSKRDQLSFDYCCWKTGLKYGHLNEDYVSGKILRKVQHGKPREMLKIEELQKKVNAEIEIAEKRKKQIEELEKASKMSKPLETSKPVEEKKKEKKIAVYTCIFGCYEKLKSPNYITPGIDYICITDNPRMKVDGWQMRLMPFELFKIQENKRQRVVKIRPDKYLPEYDVTLWVDGNIDINCNIFELLKKYPLDKSPLYICQHKQRNSIAEEAEAVIKLRKDLKDNVDKQMRFYRSVGYSCNTGLIESNIILRDNRNKACIKMQEIWEKTLLAYSHRDQLSFNYACWKTKFSYATFKDVFRVAKTTLDFKVCPHIITEPTIAIVSVNYNTSRLINLWLRSLFKQQTDISKYKVFVFDKSDKEKLVIDSVDPKRVEIIDNTTGKYVDFNGEVFLNMCKTETENHHASMRHCYAIQWLLDNIDADSLVLFDSDTILKKPLDFLAKRPRLSKVSIFGTDHNKVTTRAVPFMQYFNLNLLKCANIRYFDPTRIRGGLDSNNSAIYDTGTSFYEDIIKSGLMRCCELISVDDYISHLQHGSWVKNGKSADIKSFIESNRQYL